MIKKGVFKRTASKTSAQHFQIHCDLIASEMANLRNFLLLVGALLHSVSAAPRLGHPPTARSDAVLEGKYIITLKPSLNASSTASHLRWVSALHKRSAGKRDTVAGIEKTYSIPGWNAYAGEFDEATIADIKASPEVS